MIRAFRGESNKILLKPMMERMFHREAEIEAKWMGVPLGQGLGVFLYGQGRDFSFAHPGENFPGTTCWVTGIPGSGKGLVVMMNGASGTPLSIEILAAVGMEYQWPIGL